MVLSFQKGYKKYSLFLGGSQTPSLIFYPSLSMSLGQQYHVIRSRYYFDMVPLLQSCLFVLSLIYVIPCHLVLCYYVILISTTMSSCPMPLRHTYMVLVMPLSYYPLHSTLPFRYLYSCINKHSICYLFVYVICMFQL